MPNVEVEISNLKELSELAELAKKQTDALQVTLDKIQSWKVAVEISENN